MDADAAPALLQNLNENDSIGGEEIYYDDISDGYSSDSEPQPESTPARRKRKKARTVHTEQVPAPPPNNTVRQERGRDGTVQIEQVGDNADGRLTAQNVITERADLTSQTKKQHQQRTHQNTLFM